GDVRRERDQHDARLHAHVDVPADVGADGAALSGPDRAADRLGDAAAQRAAVVGNCWLVVCRAGSPFHKLSSVLRVPATRPSAGSLEMDVDIRPAHGRLLTSMKIDTRSGESARRTPDTSELIQRTSGAAH